MPKKRDFILIGVLLIIALAGLAVTRLLQHQSGASVTITVGGEVYGTYPLNQSREIEISDDKGYNKEKTGCFRKWISGGDHCRDL